MDLKYETIVRYRCILHDEARRGTELPAAGQRPKASFQVAQSRGIEGYRDLVYRFGFSHLISDPRDLLLIPLRQADGGNRDQGTCGAESMPAMQEEVRTALSACPKPS